MQKELLPPIAGIYPRATMYKQKLTNHSKITKQAVILSGEHCMRWGVNGSPIANITYERQDQDWILSLTRNSSTVGLNEKVERTFDKLEGHQQAGVVYFWLMLDTIINITPDVAAGLRKRIKTFGEKGVAGIYPKGENIERVVLNLSSISHSLDQLGLLPNDAISDIIKGLAKTTHPNFAKLFANFESNLDNELMTSVSLDGTIMEQIVTVMETALAKYASYNLSGEWMKVSTKRYNKSSAPPPGFKCNKCLGRHFIN